MFCSQYSSLNGDIFSWFIKGHHIQTHKMLSFHQLERLYRHYECVHVAQDGLIMFFFFVIKAENLKCSKSRAFGRTWTVLGTLAAFRNLIFKHLFFTFRQIVSSKKWQQLPTTIVTFGGSSKNHKTMKRKNKWRKMHAVYVEQQKRWLRRASERRRTKRSLNERKICSFC